MYQESTGSRKTIGDIDVVYHEGLYHLFHLVLPNHDFIAHAVSDDGISWSRVENALFIGHPGSWDDSMLWTMAVSPDPHRPGWWRMFYTGIAQQDHGLVQRIGLAFSRNLYEWTKAPTSWVNLCERCVLQPQVADSHTGLFDAASTFPLVATAPHYEHSVDEGRHWVSWRDPFYFRDQNRGWLLVAGRIPRGPVVRRGCVALLEEVGPHQFAARPALFHSGLYDDIEVPNMVQFGDQYYLLGSIREDAKVRYWHSRQPTGPWANYSDNVLLPAGNYAARAAPTAHGMALWNFYTSNEQDRTTRNLVPPPKLLVQADDGQLAVHSFPALAARVRRDIAFDTSKIRLLVDNPAGTCQAEPQADGMILRSEYDFQGFLLADHMASFRLQTRMQLLNDGKCGLLLRVDPHSHDGYYLSLDLQKGLAQMRAWGTNREATGEHMMQFRPLQAGYWRTSQQREYEITVIAFGSYFELSVDGHVILSLADQTYGSGAVGVYVESVAVRLRDISISLFRGPEHSAEHLAQG